MVPGAVFGEESRGDVRIARNGCFSKVSKIDQVVLVGKKLEIKLRKTVKNSEDFRKSTNKCEKLKKNLFRFDNNLPYLII